MADLPLPPDDSTDWGQVVRDVITRSNDYARAGVCAQPVVTGDEVRPTAAVVFWLGGSEQPVNMTDADVWFSSVESPTGPTPVAPSIGTVTLTGMTAGVAFSQTLAATGDSPIAWTVTTGTLPSGLSLSSGGVLSGTPAVAGAYDFTVTATNAAGSDTQALTGSVAAAPVPSGNLSVYGSSAPRSAQTIYNDGGESLRYGNRFYAVGSPATVLGMRVYNPADSDTTFLNLDLTGYAYLQTWSGSNLLLVGQPWNAPVRSKAHSAARVAGTWTDILFDSPLTIPALANGTTDALLTLAVQYEGGAHYVIATPPPADGDSTNGQGFALAEHTNIGRGVVTVSGDTFPTAYNIDILVEE